MSCGVLLHFLGSQHAGLNAYTYIQHTVALSEVLHAYTYIVALSEVVQFELQV